MPKHFMGKNMGKSFHPKTHKPYEFLNKELEGRVYSSTITRFISCPVICPLCQ